MSDINTSTQHLIDAERLKELQISNALNHKMLGGKVIINEDGSYKLTYHDKTTQSPKANWGNAGISAIKIPSYFSMEHTEMSQIFAKSIIILNDKLNRAVEHLESIILKE